MIPTFQIHADVVVLGSGPSGFSAAYTAAKHGAQVVLVEQNGDLGGISTSGMMSHWTGTCDSKIYGEILRRSSDKNDPDVTGRLPGGVLPMPVNAEGTVTRAIDPERLKTLYLEMLLEVNCKIMLYTFAEDAIMDGNTVRGVSVINKSGRTEIYADTVIDATGDGDIAARAGAEFTLGREEDNKMQPCTLMFKVAGVDTSRAVFLGSFESTYETEKGELQALAKLHIPHPAGHLLVYESTLPGVVTCNMTNCTDIDGTNADDLTRATVVCRNQMDSIIRYLREFVPGFEQCFLISSASMMGIRETRHFKGEYTLTGDDILNARSFEDAVVRNAHFNFDVHNISGSGLDETGVQKHFSQNRGYEIPYRCLLPARIDNLLLCGRNISGTHMAHSNFRVMPICAGIGEAAGAAAALAARKKLCVRAVPVAEIQALIF